MKTLKGLIIIALLLAFTLAINSSARAGVSEPPPPDVNVLEWMNDPFTGQYGIEIDSTNTVDWYVHWFVVENPDANSSWTDRLGWSSEFVSANDMNNLLDSYVDSFGNPWTGALATTNVIAYYNDTGINIGPNEYDAGFHWSTFGVPTSYFWAGLTFDIDIPGESDLSMMIVDGDATPGTPIPEPATLFLLGTGLAGVGAIRRKRANKT